MNTDNLASCPFCGNSSYSDCDMQPVTVVETERDTVGYGLPSARPYTVFYVKCYKCGAQAGGGVSGYNALSKTDVSKSQARKIAIDKWNRRADP